MHPDPSPRELVPDAQVRAELGGVSPMTIWRWSNDPALGFPKAVVVRQRKYRWRDEIERFKARLAEATATGEAATSAPLDPRRRRMKSRVSMEAP